ncbi:MAG: site-specific DNA-methyltransferase [Lentisphaerota bacterium]
MNKFNELIAKLREILQIDRPDLDFGIYRIINARAAEIEKFLAVTLPEKVRQSLAAGGENDTAGLQSALDKAVANARDLGADPESLPKVKELRLRIAEASAGTVDYESRVYAHLLQFFSRYYDKGDFVSKRRYKGDTYAIPYAGEEVKLYWANFDQYYTKSGENFSNYTLKLAEDKRVHFRLVSADTAKDNRKDNELERCFVLAEERTVSRANDDGEEYDEHIVPVSHDKGELVVWFDYKSMPKGTKQVDLVAAAAEKVFATPNVITNWPELAERCPTPKNPERTRLEKALTDYVSKNTADYFIHKDLGKFLSRELDFYIKNEMMNLDDIQHIKAFKEIEKNLKMIQCMRFIAGELITFMAQLEDFQKKLWLKKKFVVETNYCITLDRVPEFLYPEIVKNLKQWEEWEKLGFVEIEANNGVALRSINEPVETIRVVFAGQPDCPYRLIYGKDKTSIFENCDAKEADSLFQETVPLTDTEFVKKNPYLMLDTKLFSVDFKAKLLASLGNIDEECAGLLIHSENFQALNLIQERYKEQVKCIYIDPPYNTELDREVGNFIYKDNYAFSTWATLIYDRINIGYKLLDSSGIFWSSIDDNEISTLRFILDGIYGDGNFISCVVWKSRDSVSSDHKISLNHNYNISYCKNNLLCRFGGYHINSNDYSNPDKDPRGIWKSVPLDANKPGGDTKYGITNPNTGKIYYPPSNRSWAINQDTYKQLFNDNRISFGTKGDSAPKRKLFYQERVDKGDISTPISIWTDIETTQNGTGQIISLFHKKCFSYPKPQELLKRIIQISQIEIDVLVLDYFAGSGTTGHAVINLNREDGGKRKYILVEMGDHFNNVLKPRIEKVVYSPDWKDGKPTTFDKGISHCVKYLRLESYEDTLNNLELKRDKIQDDMLTEMPESLRSEYLLKYMLDIESRGSILSTNNFKKPFDYALNIAADSAGATTRQSIDLVETFNYLIGLRLKTCNYRPERGIAIIEGTLPGGESTLILWRDCDKVGYEELNKYCESLNINPKSSHYDVVYVNGDHGIANQTQSLESEGGITKLLKLRQIEEEFLTRMFMEE